MSDEQTVISNRPPSSNMSKRRTRLLFERLDLLEARVAELESKKRGRKPKAENEEGDE